MSMARSQLSEKSPLGPGLRVSPLGGRYEVVDRKGPFGLRLQPQKHRIPSPWGVEGDTGVN